MGKYQDDKLDSIGAARRASLKAKKEGNSKSAEKFKTHALTRMFVYKDKKRLADVLKREKMNEGKNAKAKYTDLGSKFKREEKMSGTPRSSFAKEELRDKAKLRKGKFEDGRLTRAGNSRRRALKLSKQGGDKKQISGEKSLAKKRLASVKRERQSSMNEGSGGLAKLTRKFGAKAKNYASQSLSGKRPDMSDKNALGNRIQGKVERSADKAFMSARNKGQPVDMASKLGDVSHKRGMHAMAKAHSKGAMKAIHPRSKRKEKLAKMYDSVQPLTLSMLTEGSGGMARLSRRTTAAAKKAANSNSKESMSNLFSAEKRMKQRAAHGATKSLKAAKSKGAPDSLASKIKSDRMKEGEGKVQTASRRGYNKAALPRRARWSQSFNDSVQPLTLSMLTEGSRGLKRLARRYKAEVTKARKSGGSAGQLSKGEKNALNNFHKKKYSGTNRSADRYGEKSNFDSNTGEKKYLDKGTKSKKAWDSADKLQDTAMTKGMFGARRGKKFIARQRAK